MSLNPLSFEHCSIGRESTVLIGDFSTVIDRPEVIVLLGGNGAGKSTLFYSLLRELPLLNGEIKLAGKRLDEYSSTQLAREFSFLLTHREFDEFLTVKECLELGRFPFVQNSSQFSKQDHTLIERYVDIFALDNFLDRRLANLSDGEKQRVLIARAFIQDTPFVFLDEPGNFLDVKYRLELFLLLKNISATENKVIIFSTHDIESSAKLFSRFWLVDSQEKKMVVGAEEIFESMAFKTSFTSNKISFSIEHKTFQFN
jgi:iron complex transport system ATP-binding protein